jgi:acyl-CoA reductase-like NAD-dependent aldehyde dehydrogenase
MNRHTIADGNFDERQYQRTDPWIPALYGESDRWADQAVAEREAILRRWAEVLEAFNRLREL